MQDNTVTDVLAVDVEQQEAMHLHLQIKTNLDMAAASLLEACRGLKEMKDANRYKALGFERFEDYTESALGIGSRQAYYYIQVYDRLEPEILSEHAGLGITRLKLLCEVTPLEREEFLEENDLAGMSVEEIREAIKERNGLREQLSLYVELDKPKEERKLVDEFSDLQRERDEALEKLAEATRELEVISEKEDAETEVSEENIRAALREEMADEAAQAKRDALEEARVTFEKEKAKELKLARKEAKEEAEAKAKAEIERVREEAAKEAADKAEAEAAEKMAAAEERARKLEKELSLGSSKETTAFVLHFDQLQHHFAKMAELIEAIKGKEQVEEAEKLANALEKGLEMLKQQLYLDK